ncbi:PAS domain S-box-containing protein/diguanylate cyclase (GGDEF) domain-containing protein [Cohaesibacter sp. ES.047]|uniref:two-component system response regulator n=1 Tax=Cohaesibacter sp. ES.047 TaxID=1798205 RepID=UPI000BB8CE4D|nr:EAL domain-containing protein [Cohaesibacter sp. ES.047]SNY90136.1 PAS domain S-box-containing protein/diguanylate cyclase (GGDEF) domain-containing protein [Cohaesibacter sp. ES.047]
MALILIVDDQNTNRQIYSQIARRIEDGTDVVTCAGSHDALKWLDHNDPDLILTDFNMPGMHGDDFIGQIRANPRFADVPIIVVTVFEDRNLRLRALDAGATDLLISPVDHREFVARARNLLKMHRQSQVLSNRASSLLESLKKSESILAWTQRENESRLVNVINTLPVMVSATDVDGCFLFMNSNKANYLGLKAEDVVGRSCTEVLGEQVAERNTAIDQLVIASGTDLRSFEEEIVSSKGTRKIFMTTKSPLIEGKRVIGVVTSSQDITDRKAAETHLHHMAHHDGLTGLANRSLLRDRVDREIGRCRRGDGRFALHLIDLDGFKQVNDVHGHATGDELLVRVGEQLRNVASPNDLVARLGGDEFAILQTNVKNDTHVEQLGQAITNAMPDAISLIDLSTSVTASIGIAVHPEDGNSFEKLMSNADQAMYKTKAASGNGFCLYATNLDARAEAERRVDDALKAALDDRRFELLYQPQVDLKSGDICGCEALLRMRGEDGALIAPADFLARAERNGMIMPINEWVIYEACRQGAEWHSKGYTDFTIGVNLSPVQFQRQSVPLLVARILAETGMPAHCLDLELTESIVLHDRKQVAQQLSQLRTLGIKISIDDFGTGCSSLSYVKHFPVDRLKIDQSFVRDMLKNPSDTAIVRATINLGHSLGLEVIAEGVEDRAVANALLLEHCDRAQGYYFSRPAPADEFEQAMQKQLRYGTRLVESLQEPA